MKEVTVSSFLYDFCGIGSGQMFPSHEISLGFITYAGATNGSHGGRYHNKMVSYLRREL